MNPRITMGRLPARLVASPFAAWFAYRPVRVLAPEWAGICCVSEVICSEEIARHAEAVELDDEA